MAQWLVTQNNSQFAVEDLDSLKKLARDGELSPGDMVQPPGATDWLYASEIPELKGMLGGAADDDDDVDWRGRSRGVGMLLLGLVLFGVFASGSAAMAFLFTRLPTGEERLLGEGGLAYSEMLVTEASAPFRGEPDPRAAPVSNLQKDSVLQLLAKRGDFYRARTAEGAEGWVDIGHVLPMYQLGGQAAREEFDPLYNPDRYLYVRSASWTQRDHRNVSLTVFQFYMTNSSRYDMTDLVLLATVKDAKGVELERVEIPIEGVLPANRTTAVGELAPENRRNVEDKRMLTEYTFRQKAEEDPDLELRWTQGIEVLMSARDFASAEIDLLEVRAVPPEVAQR